MSRSAAVSIDVVAGACIELPERNKTWTRGASLFSPDLAVLLARNRNCGANQQLSAQIYLGGAAIGLFLGDPIASNAAVFLFYDSARSIVCSLPSSSPLCDNDPFPVKRKH